MPELLREKSRYGARLERRDDGLYLVIADDVVVFTSRVLSAAEIEFGELVEDRSATSREARSRESAD